MSTRPRLIPLTPSGIDPHLLWPAPRPTPTPYIIRKREFDQWTDLNAVVYHGTAESRDMIRRYEWQWDELIASAMARTQGDSGDGKSLSLAASANASQKIFKFHALITSYEVIKQDLERLKKASG